MNKKGLEMGGVGTLVILAVAVIVCLTLLTGGITQGVSTLQNTVQLRNYSVVSAASGSSVNIPYQALNGVIIQNATSGAVIPATNYTVTNYVVNNGVLVTTLTSKAGADGFQGKAVNVTAVAEPFGYDTNAGGRAISGLIIIFAAIALVVAVMVPVIKNGVIDFV